MSDPKCFFIVGPTASGKSQLAVELAEKLTAEIVNLDSVQVYRGLDIGAAKPSPEQLRRVPHHLFDMFDPGREITAGDFRRLVLDFLRSYQKEHVILVGGSGFYLRAILYGMYDTPKVPLAVRTEVEKMTATEAYCRLQEADPAHAEKLSVNDSYRVRRALENILVTGKTMSEIQKEFSRRQAPFPYAHGLIGLHGEKEVIRRRVAARTQAMLEQGMIEETQRMLAAGLRDWRPLRSVGYKEVVAYLEGELPRESLAEAIIQSTMRLVKKQMTFFRGQFDVRWFGLGVSADEVLHSLLDG